MLRGGPARGRARGSQAFEAAFAEHLGSRHAVAVASCTAALHLAYLGAGVGPGDEVIVPSYTFAATAAAVMYCGATPVFADDPGRRTTCRLDPDHVAALITPRTKAVGAVHFAGYPAPVDVLRELCDARGLALVEDAAHAPERDAATAARSARGGSPARSASSPTRCCRSARAGCSAPTTTRVAALARSLRTPRERPRASPTASTSRAARCCCRGWRACGATSRARRELTRALPRGAARTVPGVTRALPRRRRSTTPPATSCRCSSTTPARRDALRIALRERARHPDQPAVPGRARLHRPTASASARSRCRAPRTRRRAR